MDFDIIKYKRGFEVFQDDYNCEKSSNEFFIVLEGKALETTLIPKLTPDKKIIFETKEMVIGPNDFFGTTSCIAARTRISSVKIAEDSSIMIVKRSEFADFHRLYPGLVYKMMNYVSNQLREYNSMLSLNNVQTSAPSENVYNLFSIGEYYFSKGKYEQSVYAFSCYLKYCIDGNYRQDAEQRLNQLSKIGICASLPEFIGESTDSIIRNKYTDGQIIFLENELDDRLFIIEEGDVAIQKFAQFDEKLLAVLKKNDIFGEMALIENKPRTASAIAVGNTTILTITKKKFDMIIRNPEMSAMVLRFMEPICERTWIAYNQLMDSIIQNPIEKIFCVLFTEFIRSRSSEKMNYQYNFGLEKLLEFIGVADKIRDISPSFNSSIMFSLSELLSAIEIRVVDSKKTGFGELRIFKILNDRLICCNVAKLLETREKIVQEIKGAFMESLRAKLPRVDKSAHYMKG